MKTSSKTTFFCQNCGAESAKWVGKCPACNEWNTYVEEVVQRSQGSRSIPASASSTPQSLDSIDMSPISRMEFVDQEFNRVLGGGLVPGSVVLVVGDPGIGKSTLLLQLALQAQAATTLYVSGEESAQQIKMRAERVGEVHANCLVLSETTMTNVLSHADQVSPQLIVIDSIQTLQTDTVDATAGSVSQIKECAAELQRYAKEKNIPVVMIGHINKEGNVAGPKILEHIVDVVLQFEGDRNHTYRILRTLKNRFGSTAELGIYEMGGDGLRQVNNPSELLISQKTEDLSGICISATMEGMRPMLIETQALVSQAVYGTPQRSSTGFDLRRLNMLLAVLEKRCGFAFGTKDVFLNIAGGIKVEDPAIDLAIVNALISSFQDISVDSTDCFAGEVGLSGEVRSVSHVDSRIKEAERLGFKRIFISKFARNSKPSSIEIIKVAKVEAILPHLFS